MKLKENIKVEIKKEKGKKLKYKETEKEEKIAQKKVN